MRNIAIVHVPHEQCEASIAEMLNSVGYNVLGIGRDVSHLLNRHMKPVVASRLQLKAEIPHFQHCKLFVTVKHYNLPGIKTYCPHLRNRVLWFDINGGMPGEHIPREPQKSYPLVVPVPYVGANKRYLDGGEYPVSGPRYVRYIPLAKRQEFLNAAHKRSISSSPVCLVHNPNNWGYGWLVERLKKECGVRFFGSHGAPDGLLAPSQIPDVLTSTLCMVHMKGRDCPGCSLYESLLTGCPAIITDLFLKRTLYTDLYVDGETCLVVKDDPKLPIKDRAEHLIIQLKQCINRLKDPSENARIGSNGRRRLNTLMWQSDREKDVESFREFMKANFK